jgi:hypothetical protein
MTPRLRSVLARGAADDRFHQAMYYSLHSDIRSLCMTDAQAVPVKTLLDLLEAYSAGEDQALREATKRQEDK